MSSNSSIENLKKKFDPIESLVSNRSYILGTPLVSPKPKTPLEKGTVGVTILLQTISTLMGFPSSCTLLKLLTPASASCLCE